MKNLYYLSVCLIFIIQSCSGQKSPRKELYNKDFNWRITIPENFESVTAEEWAKLQNRGKEAIEKTYGDTIVNNAKTVFLFKSDQFNYFESNYQPFDAEKDGDHLAAIKGVNAIIYETFKTQMPGVTLDSLSSEETIDSLKFNTFHVGILFPNQMKMSFTMYNHLFGKKDFTVNIMTIDKEKEKVLLAAWRNSKFNREKNQQ